MHKYPKLTVCAAAAASFALVAGAVLGSGAALADTPDRGPQAEAPPLSQLPVAENQMMALRSPCPGAPGCSDLPPLQPAAQGLRYIYLNFDGVTLKASDVIDDATTNTSAILAEAIQVGSTLTIPPFNPPNRAEVINEVVEDLYASHAPYNLEFVTTRPSSGTYHMVVFGGTCGSVAGQSGCAGIALQDCGDFLPNNIVYVFPGSLRRGDLAVTAAQEAAHSLGLTHTNDRNDIMFPTLQNDFPTGYGAGSVPANDQPTACNGITFQDSHQTMMDIVGFRGQDTTDPSVKITSPVSGDVVSAGATVTATISDDNVVVGARLVVNGETVESKASPPYTFTIPTTVAGGDSVVAVQADDDSGNVGADRVLIYIATGDEVPCDNGECPDGFECKSDLCVPDNGVAGELGDSCTDDDSCVVGACKSVEGESRCATSCTGDSECPSGFECLGQTACWPKADAGGGGCSVGDGKIRGGWVMLLLALGWIVRRRRR